MTRQVPGSGAVIKPIFDETFGVRAIKVVDGGTGYDPADPPRLTVTGCGTPEQEALLYPIVMPIRVRLSMSVFLKEVVDMIHSLQFFPEQETPTVVSSFDIYRFWLNHPHSPTAGSFDGTSDRLTIQSDNHPNPVWTQAEAAPGGGPLVDRNLNQTFIYRGGKDVPNPGTRAEQDNKVLGILANGGLLHTPEWGTTGNAPTNFAIDSIKYDYVKNNTSYDTVTDNNVQYYHTSKSIDEFKLENGVFEWGKFKQFTWNVKLKMVM